MNTLHEIIRPNSHFRIINKVKNKVDNNSLKNTSSMRNIKAKKIIFNKKILINNNIASKNKIHNSFNIKYEYLQNNENIKTLQTRSELLNNSIPKNNLNIEIYSFNFNLFFSYSLLLNSLKY